jgi:hypothetical protein
LQKKNGTLVCAVHLLAADSAWRKPQIWVSNDENVQSLSLLAIIGRW